MKITIDKKQIFGLFTLLFSLFFGLVVTHGSARILFVGGVIYGFVFILHARIEKIIIPRIRRPLLAYGICVFLNGLFVEVLAYMSNRDTLQAGGKAYLFGTSSLLDDLVMGLPYYLVNACGFMWSLKRYQFSTFQLGLVIWLFNAIAVDEFRHFFALLSGNVFDFVGAGILMLFAFHTPIVIFENKLRETYPARNNSWIKYPIVFFIQFLALGISLVTAVMRFIVLPRLQSLFAAL